MMRSWPKQPPIRLNDEVYAELRRQILERDAWRCQRCGSFENLEVHHKKLRSQCGADSEENLITLCTRCHAWIHTNRML